MSVSRIFRKEGAFVLFVGFVAVLAAWLYWALMLQKTNHLFISEVSFANNSKQDWIEIYNPSLNNLTLKNWYVSDDSADPTRFQIPFDLIIVSHGTVTLYGKKAEDVPANAGRLNFNLSSGETVVLSDPSGKQIDKLSLVAPPQYDGRFTVGRTDLDRNSVEVIYAPTPSGPNETF